MTEHHAGPNLTLTATYPPDSTPEEMITGIGLRVTMTGEQVSAQVIIHALLMAAEQLMLEKVREIHAENQDPMTMPLPATAQDSLVAMNARLLMLHELHELPFRPTAEMHGFDIDLP